MTRLIMVVEGQSEEAFVKDVLVPHLANHGVGASATIVGKVVAQKRGHRHRGGGSFKHWRADIGRILRGDASANLRVTTLFDLYGLPDDFPGLSEHGADTDTLRRAAALEAALGQELGDCRLLPYVQRHEFEALVLAALPALDGLFDADDDRRGLANLAASTAGTCPEDVNDGQASAPSKRLAHHVPGFRKTLHGPAALKTAGLQTIRTACPRFDAWVHRLETLGVPP